MKIRKPLVSIIIPVYNAENFLKKTIDSIKLQTYDNWEAIFIDDCSTDDSILIISKEQENESRIKLIKNSSNCGPACTRNKGIELAKGEFICFLDSDDFWPKEKIYKQLSYMMEKNIAFSFTGYEFADKNGIPTGKIVHVPHKISYKEALKNTTISTPTVMLNMNILSKDDIFMPNVKSEDTACWWKILKKIDYAYGIDEILFFYRRTSTSLSANKFVALKRTWNLYREVEKLNLFYSINCFCKYVFNAIKRRI